MTGKERRWGEGLEMRSLSTVQEAGNGQSVSGRGAARNWCFA